MAQTPPVDLPEWYHESFDPYCLEVGRLNVIWASHEAAIDRLLWELLDVEALSGLCLTSQFVGPGPRGRALAALVRHKGASEELEGDFIRFVSAAQKLGGKRNRYAHDTVTIGTVSGVIRKTEATADKQLRYESPKIDLNAIRALWIEIRNSTKNLEDLRQRLIYELPAWTRKRFEQSVNNQLHGEVDQD